MIDIQAVEREEKGTKKVGWYQKFRLGCIELGLAVCSVMGLS